jgi:hypothetical protein
VAPPTQPANFKCIYLNQNAIKLNLKKKIIYLDIHLSYGPDFYIARTLVMLSFVAAKVAKAFFAGGV